MSGALITRNDDPIWEGVVETLSKSGYMARFYKIPRHELKAISRLWGKRAVHDLTKVFLFTQQKKLAERDAYLESLTEGQVFAMLIQMGRNMKCWIETELTPESRSRLNKSKWTIANS